MEPASPDVALGVVRRRPCLSTISYLILARMRTIGFMGIGVLGLICISVKRYSGNTEGERVFSVGLHLLNDGR